MTQLSQTMDNKDLPPVISFIAKSGVVLLPGGLLPFHAKSLEDLHAIDRAFMSDRLIGIVQPMKTEAGKDVLFRTGCLGKITTFTEGADGSYFLIISGISSFSILAEQKLGLLQVDYLTPSVEDEPATPYERIKLLTLLKDYLKRHGISVNWDDVVTASDESLITSLAMMCPFEATEKQAILESQSLRERFEMLMAFLEVSQYKNSKLIAQMH